MLLVWYWFDFDRFLDSFDFRWKRCSISNEIKHRRYTSYSRISKKIQMSIVYSEYHWFVYEHHSFFFLIRIRFLFLFRRIWTWFTTKSNTGLLHSTSSYNLRCFESSCWITRRILFLSIWRWFSLFTFSRYYLCWYKTRWWYNRFVRFFQ